MAGDVGGGVGGRIRPLPPLLVNQIAAGEVIERPASVVKELLENALDAGAGRVSVQLERGGTELVRVVDDGVGMGPEDLPLSLAPHATSKIAAASDLDRIATMGFRGEALASIASVSRMSIRSRRRGAGEAWVVEAEGETVGELRPAAGPEGTVVEVRSLFFNTPARRKFLRTPQTEQQRCLEWVRDLAMARPGVAFEVECDGRRVMDLPAASGPRERVLAILGREMEPELLKVRADEADGVRGMVLWGLAGRPSLAKATAKGQHVFLNGRAVRERTVQHALREAYRGLIEPSRHPVVVLMLEMDPGAVDVNVHPAKLEVRFRDQSAVHSAVLGALRSTLRGADLTSSVSPRVADGGGRGVGDGGSEAARPAGFFDEPAPAVKQAPLDLEALREALEPKRSAAASEAEVGVDADAGDTSLRDAVAGSDEASGEGSGTGGGAPVTGTTARRSMLQVHNSYVVTQDEDGVVIIDQHALHERAMFELLSARLAQGDLESQRLLTPAVVDVSPGQIEAMDRLEGLLGRIGVSAEAMGPRSIGVHAFPTFLFDRGVEPGQFVRDLLEKAEGQDLPPGEEEALHEVLDMMACKAAVKAGDRMSDAELEALVNLREGVERSGSCPHGRPTSVRLTLRELERLFHRR